MSKKACIIVYVNEILSKSLILIFLSFRKLVFVEYIIIEKDKDNKIGSLSRKIVLFAISS